VRERVIVAATFWGVLLAVIAFIFWRLWKLAIVIEEQEAEEYQWREYIEYLHQSDPYQAQYWQQQFEERFK